MLHSIGYNITMKCKGNYMSRDGRKFMDNAQDEKDKLFCNHCNNLRLARKIIVVLLEVKEVFSGGVAQPSAHHTSVVETTTNMLQSSVMGMNGV